MDADEQQIVVQSLKEKLLSQIELIRNKKLIMPYRLNTAVVITDLELELNKLQLSVIATSSLKILRVFEYRILIYLKIAVKPHL